MNTFTLITENGHSNKNYNVESVSIAPQRFIVVVNESETDDFLMEFINGNTGYRIVIDTDILRVETKGVCFSENNMRIEDGSKIAFVISVEKKIS